MRLITERQRVVKKCIEDFIADPSLHADVPELARLIVSVINDFDWDHKPRRYPSVPPSLSAVRPRKAYRCNGCGWVSGLVNYPFNTYCPNGCIWDFNSMSAH